MRGRSFGASPLSSFPKEPCVTIIREASYGHVTHPEHLNGRRVWRDGHIEEIVRRLQQGDPTKGWEGDPRLEVYFEPTERRWELWRLEHDGQYRRVLYSDPGKTLDFDVIDHLVAHDRNRGFDVQNHIEVVNGGIRNRRSAEFSEWVAGEVAPRIAHAASRGRIHR